MPDDRDHQKPKHGLITPVGGVPIGEFETPQEDTGNYRGPELAEKRQEIRGKRDTKERVSRVEERTDRLDDKLTEYRQEVNGWRLETTTQIGGLTGAVGTLAGEVSGLKTVIQDARANNQLITKANIEVGTAKELDKLDARKNRRERWTKAFGFVAGGAGVWELIHRLFL